MTPAEVEISPDKVSRGGESAAHRELKRMALEWALAHRLVLCGEEVRLPRSNYRADVAAASPRSTSAGACTAVFECKSTRADFRRDAADEIESAQNVAALRHRLAVLRAAIADHHPNLHRGDELFPAFEAIDLRGFRHETHDRLTRELRAAENQMRDGTKFCRLRRWRSASLLYLVTSPDVAAPAELPDGWGWLEKQQGTLVLRARPCLHETSAAERIALIERIAATAAARTRRAYGIAWAERWVNT